MAVKFKMDILPQPDDETCGATCLHALYRYYGEEISLPEVIREIPAWETGGTIAVILGCHALLKGYKARIYTYNLQVFDPTWFHEGVDLTEKLKKQYEAKEDPKVRWATQAYIKFLSLGGEIRFEELNVDLLRKYLDKGKPVLTGLNATYLYRCARELNNEYEDIKGYVMGHFVILGRYIKKQKKVEILDPLMSNPFLNQKYKINVDRVINSIMLGILTYDANLLIVDRKKHSEETE